MSKIAESKLYSLYNLEYPYRVLIWAVVGATPMHYDLESRGRKRTGKRRIKKSLVAPHRGCLYYKSPEHLFDVCKKREIAKIARAEADIARAKYEIEILGELLQEYAG